MSKPTLGIIGGGQLGSMLASAAKKLNINTIVLSDDKDAPAKTFCNQFIFSKYDNDKAIDQFVKSADVITFEFENIPYETLNKINKKKHVLPHPSINKVVQNRFFEKKFINKLNISTTNYTLVKKVDEIEQHINLLPGLLKTCTLGYDGKGQFKINSPADIKKMKIDFYKGYILEKIIDLKKEISVIITRFKENKYEIYEPIENKHEDQILKKSKLPADINEEIFKKSKLWAIKIAEKLNYVGTLCVEYFIDINDNLYVNEIAPRVHNSGHLTINAYNISQFENHIRAIFQMEQIKLSKKHNAEMINILGEEINDYKNKSFKENEFFFDYKKKEIKKKRKMGHLTITKNI